jgi:hypothetical protein
MFKRYLFLALILLTTARLRAGEVLDQMVATVNGHAILASDWDDELRYDASCPVVTAWGRRWAARPSSG